MQGERAEIMPQEIVDALEYILSQITWDDAMHRLGVSRQTIVAIEAAKYAPSLELAFQIAHAFGRPIGEVFQWAPK